MPALLSSVLSRLRHRCGGGINRDRAVVSCRRFCDKNGVCIRTESVNCHWSVCQMGVG